MAHDDLLSIQDLSVSFGRDDREVQAVRNISFDIGKKETVALVGESGSGKSVTALSVMQLLPYPMAWHPGGSITFNGVEMIGAEENDLSKIRGDRIGIIFQEPMTSLNPVLTIGRQLTEALQLHLHHSMAEANARAVELLHMVGIPAAEERLFDYPHQFSGGMRQRVMIAMALSCDPKLLLADEPTTALDVTIQAQVLEVMARLSRELGTSVIVITHNLGVVARYADRVNVMYGGRIVEMGPATDIYHEPRHAYTLGLLESVPRLDAREGRLIPIEGSPPDLTNLPSGCAFSPRCRFATDQCREERPELVEVAPDHLAACWHFDEVLGEARQKATAEAEV